MSEVNYKKKSDANHLYNEKNYVMRVFVILGICLFFLMMRFGAIFPNLEKIEIKGFKIVNLSKTIAAFYLIWFYLYLSFYQKYWILVRKSIVELKESIFEDKIAFSVLQEIHERHKHNFDWYNIHALKYFKIMQFWISYSPVSFLDHGEEDEHSSRFFIIDLKSKNNRKYITRYLVNVYFQSPLVTSYLIPIIFPILAVIICFTGKWPGSLFAIITGW